MLKVPIIACFLDKGERGDVVTKLYSPNITITTTVVE